MFKSQLQEFAQRAELVQPVYKSFKEGPSHEPIFQASVSVNGQTYESPSGFATLKAAQHAAAKVALDALNKSRCETGVVPIPMHESGLCKNLLQEHAQKSSLPLPVYRTIRSGQEHSPIFTSTVDIGGVLYVGGPSKVKKEAEIKAARTALVAIEAQSCFSGKTFEAFPEFAQVAIGSSNKVSQAKSLKKRGRDPKDGVEKKNGTKYKKGLFEESSPSSKKKADNIYPDTKSQHQYSLEKELQVCTSCSTSS